MDSFNNLEYINISSFSRLLDDDSPAIIAEALKIALGVSFIIIFIDSAFAWWHMVLLFRGGPVCGIIPIR